MRFLTCVRNGSGCAGGTGYFNSLSIILTHKTLRNLIYYGQQTPMDQTHFPPRQSLAPRGLMVLFYIGTSIYIGPCIYYIKYKQITDVHTEPLINLIMRFLTYVRNGGVCCLLLLRKDMINIFKRLF